MELNPEKHLEQVNVNAVLDISAKYRKGQAEHGGEIWRKGLLTLIGPEIRAEAVDLMVYTECLNVGLRRIRQIVARELTENNNSSTLGLREILAILDGEVVDKV